MPQTPIKERLARNDTLRTIFVPVSILVTALGVAVTIWTGDQAQQDQAEQQLKLEAARVALLAAASPNCDQAADELRRAFKLPSSDNPCD